MAIAPARELDGHSTLILPQHDVRRVLRMPDCIAAVEQAFVSHAKGDTVGPGVLGMHVTGGGFHVKAAGIATGDRPPMFAAKINANFPENPTRHALPTIQGVLGLFDATNGRVLALMDSGELTSIRTAAASAVAAKYCAPQLTNNNNCGCGEQSSHQVRAVACVRSLQRVRAFDINRARAVRFADDIRRELDVDSSAIDDLSEAWDATIWITCTPARRWFLGRRHVRPGAFVAAVGADSPEKQELEPELLAGNALVVDVLDQSATIGALHHAIKVGVMRREDTRAELADIVSGRVRGRISDDEIIIFDSTGTALQDVAAATVVYDHALARGDCLTLAMSQA